MRSLAAIAELAPAATLRPDATVGMRLQRLCDLLGISGVRLATLAADGSTVVDQRGADAKFVSLQTRALAAAEPLVIADTGLEHFRFYVGIILPAEGDHPAQLLSLFDPRPRSPMMAATLAALAGQVLAQATIARQRRRIEAQQQTIVESQLTEDVRRSLFDRASATARIGIWQCNLADKSITWTNGVYDLFEIPRNAPITREITLTHYTETSRREMEMARAQAIATCSDFTLNAEIITTTGKRRWMRLTGAVDSRNGVAHRIFGMKQDITEEKLLADRTRYLAEFDVMTGLANRSLFQARLAALDQGQDPLGALLLIDLDGFKQVNDTYGHAIGDECLKEAALRLVESCGGAELVARIGGDEFAVLLNAGTTPADAEALAGGIVDMMRRPVTRLGQTLRLGASVGVAHYSAGSSEDLFRQADMALYEAKAAGRDTSCTFAT